MLVRRGMAAWMLSVSAMDRPVQHRERKKEGGPIDGMLGPEKTELVKVLGCMILDHEKEGIGGHTERS